MGGDTLSILPAGLPNIMGSFHAGAQVRIATGAFTGEPLNAADPQGSGRITHNYNFDASLCSPVYGTSETVQPPTISLLPQIKF